MANTMQIIRRWWWIWAIHGLLIAIMYQFFFFKNADWYTDSFPALGLSFEMNYAVWWSGICLFLAALVYFRLAQFDIDRRKAWNVLGLVALALCLDEIGSLHETVSQISESAWLGLLPFAVIIGGGFSWSLYQLSKSRETWLPGVLIFLGVAIFGCVAALEFIEHNIDASAVEQRLRLILEEGSELIAMGLLITAGLIAYLRSPACKNHDARISLSSISGVIGCGFEKPVWLFVIFAANLSLAALFVIPNYTLFPFEIGEGNITSLFPVLLFTSLGFYCFHRAIDSGRAWLFPGAVMVITSLLQMYNFTRLINNVLQSDFALLRYPPDSWLATLLPWLVIVLFTRSRCQVSWRTITGHLAILLTVFAFLIPGAEDRILSDCYYFLLSSCVGYSCFHFLLLEFRSSQGLSQTTGP